ncbi:MAG: hypothetical protein AW07_03618 [Candidatus Accumulibacter sp. SK-11]|nr:MAG: hypothetical protein AW07_03618 [Candidatus Accumulibacter sp. SK-11]
MTKPRRSACAGCRFLRVGKSRMLMKSSSSSPVMPSGSAAQLRQRSGSGIGER